jgi:glucose/arabinose dehydrogenase
MRAQFGLATLAAALLIGMPAQAQESPLTGQAAFGDWRADQLGVKRLITADDLEAPDMANSASNAPGGVDRPANAAPVVPKGFAATLVAEGIPQPRVLRFAPNGDLYIADSASGEVVFIPAGDLAAGTSTPKVYASSLDAPYGLAFYPASDPKWLYVAETGRVVRFAWNATDGMATSEPEVIVPNLPTGGHWTRDIAFSPDGKVMYVAVGSDSNVARQIGSAPNGGLDAWIGAQPLGAAWNQEERRAVVLAFDPDGKNERVFATGLRNCAGMTVQPQTGALWCVVNERDGMGDNVPYDYATSVGEGRFYGWPWYYIGDNPDPRWASQPRDDLKGKVTVPDVLFQAHSAPLGITFHSGKALGADYAGDAFVTLRGSWNRGSRTGYKLVRLDIDASGRATGIYEDFAIGFVIDDERVWGRPVGITEGMDGALYMSEDGSGTIWRIARE